MDVVKRIFMISESLNVYSTIDLFRERESKTKRRSIKSRTLST
jgi:hypothetical protein